MKAPDLPAPRLCRGLMVLPFGDRLLVEGAARRQVFSGKAATGALAKLLPLLDGTRDAAALAAGSDLPERTVAKVVALLDDCDLIEYVGARAEPASPPPEHVASYFSRTIGATGRHAGAPDVLAALASGSVLITGQDPAADLVAADLTETGVGTVKRVEGGVALAAAREPHPAAERRLIVVFDEPHEPGLLGEVAEAAGDTATLVLRCARDGDSAQLGPLFAAGFTACADCFRRSRREAAAPHGAGLGPGLGRQLAAAAGSLAEGLLAALAGAEILAVLARTTAPESVRTLIQISLPGLETRRWLVAPYPDCPRCQGPETGRPGDEPGGLYEWQVERAPAALAWAGRPPRAERQRHEALQTRRTAFPLSPQRALPAEEPAPGGGRPTPATLASILRRAVGLRSPARSRTDRWTASGGNLGAIEAYLIAEPRLLGLPGSIARYDDLGDRLQGVNADPVPVARCLQGTGLDPEAVAAVVVLVAAVGRQRQKYGSFTYRLAHLDTGCAAVALAAAARAHGLDPDFAPGWPAGLADLLELEPGGELVAAVAALRRPAAGMGKEAG